MNELPLLSMMVFAPWAGALALALLPRLGTARVRALTLTGSLTTILIGLALLAGFEPRVPGYQFVENRVWMETLGIRYHFGLDGLSLVLVLLTGVVGPAGLVASWREAREPRLFGLLFLLLQGSALGVFLALDFVPWFLFWELSLVPAFFLIKLWGGAESARAAYQFVVYTLAGSALMLLGFVALIAVGGTASLPGLAALAADGSLDARLTAAVGPAWAALAFAGVFFGVAVKAPLFPFHTWLPGAYAEAPTGVSMFLTGVMSKMGVYGFFRVLWPIFPERVQAASGALLLLALAGVVMGAFAALAQRDLKRMLAYSSINHVSLCLLALFAVAPGPAAPGGAALAALNGALLQMFNHGVSAAALFYCVGVLEARAGGRRDLGDFGGVRAAAPVFAGFCGVAMFSSLGLPGLAGFVGEFLIFRGVFAEAPWVAAAACLGLLATAIFLLTFYQRVFHGPPGGVVADAAFADISATETGVLAPLLALMIVLGVAPQLLIGLTNPLTTLWASGVLSP